MDCNACHVHTKSYFSVWSFETVRVSVLYLKSSASCHTPKCDSLAEQITEHFSLCSFNLAGEDFEVCALEKAWEKKRGKWQTMSEWCFTGIMILACRCSILVS